jgi:hypothetical protein
MTIWKLQTAELKRERRELEAGFEGGPNTLEDKYLETKKVRFGGLAFLFSITKHSTALALFSGGRRRDCPRGTWRRAEIPGVCNML